MFCRLGKDFWYNELESIEEYNGKLRNWLNGQKIYKRLHTGQKITIEGEETYGPCTGGGVRQDCCMPQALFNTFGKLLITEILEGIGRILIGGQRINIIKYINDQTIIYESIDDLQEMVE